MPAATFFMYARLTAETIEEEYGDEPGKEG
jgi:hypothetical protein